MHVDTQTVRTAFSRETIRWASKVFLGLTSLIVVLILASTLPGVDRLVPATGVTLKAVISALATTAVVALLVYLATGFAALTRLALSGPREIVESVASLVYWLVVLAAVLIAHAGFSPMVASVFGDAVLVYDLVFLLVALVPLAVVAARLYVVVDPAAEYLTESLVDDADGDAETDQDEGEGDAETNESA